MTYDETLLDEVFQSDCMTELASELDDSDMPSRSEHDEDVDEVIWRRNKKIEHAAMLNAHAALTDWEKRANINVWEEIKPEFRSAKVSTRFNIDLEQLLTKKK